MTPSTLQLLNQAKLDTKAGIILSTLGKSTTPITAQELTRQLTPTGITYFTINRRLNILLHRKLITTTRDTSDQRKRLYSLTTKGLTLHHSLTQTHQP